MALAAQQAKLSAAMEAAAAASAAPPPAVAGDPAAAAAAPARPLAHAFGAESAKVVHLVRHGQGFHNVEAAVRGPAAYKDVRLTDARLDETGRRQAATLGERVRAARMIIDVVLVSPLTRTLETATLMFPPEVAPLPFVAVEHCREAFGGHPCDARRPARTLAREFPHVDFSGLGTDEDTWHDPDRRETVREVAQRCDQFLAVLRARPERNLVVVSHGVFLETLLNRCGLRCDDDAVRAGRFENAEMRSIVIGAWLGS